MPRNPNKKSTSVIADAAYTPSDGAKYYMRSRKANVTLNAVNAILERTSVRMTLRQMYYRLISAKLLKATKNDYKYLSSLLVRARKAGWVAVDALEDRTRTDDIVSDVTQSVEQHVALISRMIRSLSENYEMERWDGQTKKVVIFLEKDALRSVFEEITNRLEVSLVVGRGYSSYSQLLSVARQLNDDENAEREIIVLLFGDFDPSGRDILRSFEAELVELGVKAEFRLVALLETQIEQYKLITLPVKQGDSRSKRFVEKYGDKAVELDALEPEVLQQLLVSSIEQHFDESIYRSQLAIHEERVAKLRQKMSILLESDAFKALTEE